MTRHSSLYSYFIRSLRIYLNVQHAVHVLYSVFSRHSPSAAFAFVRARVTLIAVVVVVVGCPFLCVISTRHNIVNLHQQNAGKKGNISDGFFCVCGARTGRHADEDTVLLLPIRSLSSRIRFFQEPRSNR